MLLHRLATATATKTMKFSSAYPLALLASSAQICGAFQQKQAFTSTTTTLKMATQQDKGDLNPPIKEAWGTPLKVGDTVPSVTFKTRVRIESEDQNPFDWKDVTSEDLFKGKRVVLFGLPGAFTPLCSSEMVPGYDEARPELLELGIDEVYCLSVNDAFVMRQWGLNQGYVLYSLPSKTERTESYLSSLFF